MNSEEGHFDNIRLYTVLIVENRRSLWAVGCYVAQYKRYPFSRETAEQALNWLKE